MSIPFRRARLGAGSFASGSVLLTASGLTLSVEPEVANPAQPPGAESVPCEVELPWPQLARVAVRHPKLRPRLEIRLQPGASDISPRLGTSCVRLPIARTWAPDADLLARRANASIAAARESRHAPAKKEADGSSDPATGRDDIRALLDSSRIPLATEGRGRKTVRK